MFSKYIRHYNSCSISCQLVKETMLYKICLRNIGRAQSIKDYIAFWFFSFTDNAPTSSSASRFCKQQSYKKFLSSAFLFIEKNWRNNLQWLWFAYRGGWILGNQVLLLSQDYHLWSLICYNRDILPLQMFC